MGAVALFLLLKRSTDCVESRRRQWIAIAALAAGVGVWATHFIAMLAYRGAVPLRFDPGRTALSVLFAILFFWLAFLVAGRSFRALQSLAAGLLAASGVAAMHFAGMAAIVGPVAVRYDWNTVIIAFATVALAFASSFFLFGRLDDWRRIALPASLAVFGVVALHFTAVSATTLVPDPVRGFAASPGDSGWLLIGIVAATMALIGLVLAGAILDRLFTDMRGLTEATLEGLAIVGRGGIVEANSQLAALLGVDRLDLLGSDPACWFKTVDGAALDVERPEACEALVQRRCGAELIVEIAVHAIEYRGRRCRVLAIRDLTARKEAERHIKHLAVHDALTGLPNRVGLATALADIEAAGESFALFALDLDRFKAVNDLFGHAAGDAILCRVAAILKDAVRDGDIVARIGGDEFLIVQRNVEDVTASERLAQRIHAGFALEMDISRDPMAVGASIGVAMFPADASDVETLRHNADVALYRAKERGRGIACFFDLDMDRIVRERRALEHDLRHAIKRGQLSLVFQPLVATDGGAIVGYEALLRWLHPERGQVAPETFVPIAEDIGAIVPIGEWVLREACIAAAHWPDHINIAVNVSAIQFQLPNLASMVGEILAETGIRPERLELEVTESVMLRDRDAVLDTLYRLKALGVRIVMDDFGTGYSSLSNLQAFSFDKIKIDRSFVSHVADDASARSIIRAIVGLGRSLDLPVVAEGVETEAQRLMVLEEGCPQAQGFLFGMPEQVPLVGPSLRIVGGRG
ncbi:bifunctional diguanylate cyclase/phosphodiesterase [Sphingopyxis terrae]|uniref:bifunctional diguanylate cyclase/phosphodiesterase n=1 Tax=Sphingopyxis terrae TaxID=33052 RepID=UPI002A0D3F06|nr:EAL domain-containing protein [Sphingopyxis terrae]MDX8357593.1 EAL domain-containing protein [Sphingopyxis terrae]